MLNVRVAEIASVMQRGAFLPLYACLVACSSGNNGRSPVAPPTVFARQMSAMINGISWTAIAVDVDLTIDPSVIRVTATRGALGPSLETLEIGFLRVNVGV